LGIKALHGIITGMIARQTFDKIMDKDEKDFSKRMHRRNTEADREQIKKLWEEKGEEINRVLRDLNRDLLWIF